MAVESPIAAARRPLSIVAESDDWLVIDKPPFLEVHPTKPGGNPTLWDGLRALLSFELMTGGQVSIINRLDRETSGLTLVAKTRDAARTFSRLMADRAFQKEYLAIAWGWPAEDEWVVDAPMLRLGEVEPFRIHLKQGLHPRGVPSKTRFRVERRFERETPNGHRFSVIRAFPETGRTHQIRVHLSASGHPIVGDKIYGPDEQCYLEFIETGWTEALAQRLILPRHALHATGLSIRNRGLDWQTSLPMDLKCFLPT